MKNFRQKLFIFFIKKILDFLENSNVTMVKYDKVRLIYTKFDKNYFNTPSGDCFIVM